MKYSRAIMLSLITLVPCTAAHAEDGWRIGLNSGVTLYSGDQDPRFASIQVARDFEQGYIQIGISMIDGAVTQGIVAAVPVSSETVTLAGGRSFGDVSFDGYASVGQRRFKAETLPGGRVTVNTNGSSFAIGGALTYELELSDSISIAPFAALDYDKVDVGRFIILPNGDARTVKSKEDGVTGSAGVSLQKMFGTDQAHSFAITAAFVATSNGSSTRSGTGANATSRIVAARNVSAQSDEWAELGASASFAVAEKLRLNLNANRTLGFAGPEATTVAVGASLQF